MARQRKAKKRYMVDTSVIMDDIDILAKLYDRGENEIYISNTVLEEIDKHKTSINPSLGFAARSFVRSFVPDSMKRVKTKEKKNDFVAKAAIKTNSGLAHIYIVTRKDFKDNALSNDMKILEVAKDYNAKLLTNDASFKLIALSEGVPAESILEGSIQRPEDITFHKTITLNKDVQDISHLTPSDLDMTKWGQLTVQKDDGQNLFYIANGTGFFKVDENFQDLTVKPINTEQKFYANVLKECKDIIVVSGSTGSGKTLFALQEGIRRVQNKEVGGIVYMRFTVNAGDKFSELGYRKGGEEEKLSYYNYPLYGAINFLMESQKNKEFKNTTIGKSKETVAFMDKYNIEVMDIAHARGITITNRFVIFDEVQNTPINILKLIGTRIGMKSTLVLMGDYRQVDHPYLDKHRNSLVYMLKKAQETDIAGIILEKTVRSDTAKWFQDNIETNR